MRYLLDTNICIYIINKKPSIVLEKIQTISSEEIGISTITVAELDYGITNSKSPVQNRLALLEFLLPLIIIDYEQKDASFYGMIRKELETNGKIIGPLDLLLASQAMARDLILVTNNVREFKRIKGLKIQNWAEK
jgi:tRNA(fMet)-specific endonuclease VapC